MHLNANTVPKRKGKKLMGFEDIYLKAKAITWSGLSDMCHVFSIAAYSGTTLIRKRTPLGPYHRPMPRVLGGS